MSFVERPGIKHAKCVLLEEMGFTIEHSDSRVSFKGYTFDFSATACDRASLMYTALTSMFEIGRQTGRSSVINDFKQLLELGEDK